MIGEVGYDIDCVVDFDVFYFRVYGFYNVCSFEFDFWWEDGFFEEIEFENCIDVVNVDCFDVKVDFCWSGSGDFNGF